VLMVTACFYLNRQKVLYRYDVGRRHVLNHDEPCVIDNIV